MNSDANWAQATQKMQETLNTMGAGVQQALGAMGGASPLATTGLPPGFPPLDFSKFATLGQNLPAIHFDPAKLQVSIEEMGFGLFSIRERLDHLGGTMRVRSAPGCGTQVILGVSVPAEARRFEELQL